MPVSGRYGPVHVTDIPSLYTAHYMARDGSGGICVLL